MIIADPNTVINRFTSAFVLDKPKLTRILNIIEDRFKEADLVFKPEFEVTHADGKQIKIASTEDLFALDNTVKNPITNLHASATAIKRTDSDSYDTKAMQCSFGFDEDKRNNIRLTVKAETGPKLANQIFAELEEQIERTFARGWVYKYLKSDKGDFFQLVIMGLLGLVLTGFSVYLGVASDSKVTKPNEGDIQVLIEKSKRANTTESKIDFLLEAETKQLEWSAEQPKSTFRLTRLLNLRNLFIVLPILIILGCVFYLLGWCYPRTVFLWGDFEAHYNDLISKKKAIWSLVILSLVFGIIGNLFVYGLSSYVRIG